MLRLSRPNIFVETNICRDKDVFVATKMILVAAPAKDRFYIRTRNLSAICGRGITLNTASCHRVAVPVTVMYIV